MSLHSQPDISDIYNGDEGKSITMWDNVIVGLIISFLVGAGAFSIICPKRKRGQLANRITAVISLLVFSSFVLVAIFMPRPEFSLKLFLFEGVLLGVIAMGIIYGIAEAIHWAITGKSMALSELQDLGHKFEKDVFWFLRKRN